MNKLKSYRRDLHQIPELGFLEFKTQQYLLNVVKGFKCQVYQVKTGLILHFNNNARRTIAFRADMDGLPIHEKTNAKFASAHPGIMHACGHDGHMAILLGLAEWLNHHDKPLDKNIILIFQPSEEKDAGANKIIDSQILQKHHVEAIFGLHLWPGLASGTVWSRTNELMAAANEVDIRIAGKAAHVASSERGSDALHVASQLITTAYEMVASLPKTTYRLLKFGEMHSGSVRNAISDETMIYGSIRSYDPKVHNYLQTSLQQIASDYDQEFGTTTTITYKDGYDAVINDAKLVKHVKNFIPAVGELEKPVLQAEDFGLYRKICPIMFMFLGVGNVAPLHNEKFDFDMEVLNVGLELFIKLVQSY